MEPSNQKEAAVSETKKRGKLVGKLLVGLFTLSTTVIAMVASYSEESGKADSQQSIDRFKKALGAYVEEGGRSDVDPLGGLKTSNSWRTEIEESSFVVHMSKKQNRDEMEKDVDARSVVLAEARERLEKAANALGSYKNQSIAKGKIFTSVKLYNEQAAQKNLPLKIQPTRQEILDRIREKYPQYNDLSDDELASGIAKKYPTYKPYLEKDQVFQPQGIMAKDDIDAFLDEREDLNPANQVVGKPFDPDAYLAKKRSKFGEIPADDSKESIEYTKSAAMPWSTQNNLALYGKVAAWTLGIGLVAYIAIRLFVFIIVLIWWFMIDRIKDVSNAIKG